MTRFIETLEREGGHIIVLFLVGCLSFLTMCWSCKPTVEAVAHDVAIGSFSALLALLKGNGNGKNKHEPNTPPSS